VIHAARVRQHPPKLMPPPRPRGGITAAKDRTTRHTVAASLAPWRAAIAEVRAPHRAARIVAPSTQHAARAPAAGAQSHAAHTNAASGAPQLHRSNHSVLIPWTVSQPQSPPQPRHSNHSELIPWTVSRRQSPPRPHRSNHSELIPWTVSRRQSPPRPHRRNRAARRRLKCLWRRRDRAAPRLHDPAPRPGQSGQGSKVTALPHLASSARLACTSRALLASPPRRC